MSDPTAIASLLEPYRRGIVTHVLERLEADDIDVEVALVMLDGVGLTGDREALSDALAGRDMATGLLDGTYDPKVVDPELTICGEQAREVLAERFAVDADDAILKLATPREAVAVSA